MKETYRDFMGMMKKFTSDNQDKKAFLNLDLMEYFVSWFEAAGKETQIDFIEYAFEYWKAYTMDTINGNYRYITYTDMVWSGYIKQRKEKGYESICAMV